MHKRLKGYDENRCDKLKIEDQEDYEPQTPQAKLMK